MAHPVATVLAPVSAGPSRSDRVTSPGQLTNLGSRASHRGSPGLSDDPNDPLARPSWACCLCPPPRNHNWVRADDRHATCSPCYQRMREQLDEVESRYLQLDPRPGGSGIDGSRGAPGFGSRPPGSVHIMAARDPRSSQVARVWVGRDGRVHAEDERPVPSVHGVLSTLAWAVAEHRAAHGSSINGEVAGPDDRADVFGLARYLDKHIDHVTRYAELALEVDAALRDLLGVLRPVTGARRRKAGNCPTPVVVDEESGRKEPCGTKLYASLDKDLIVCPSCGTPWRIEDWLEQLNGAPKATDQARSAS